MRTRLAALLATATLGLVVGTAPVAQASTGGTPDTENQYDGVGLILFHDSTGRTAAR